MHKIMILKVVLFAFWIAESPSGQSSVDLFLLALVESHIHLAWRVI